MTSLGIDIGGSSVKAAMIRDGIVTGTNRSAPYRRPSPTELAEAIRAAVAPLAARPDVVGLCLPGLFDHDLRRLTLSVNLPEVVGTPIDQLIASALGFAIQPAVFSDARATAHSFYIERQLSGRLFSLTLGTGIGAAVLDDGAVALQVDGDSPGHFGQLDVSLPGEPVIGPDGGRGSLEGYIGAAALLVRLGDQFYEKLDKLTITEPPLQALIQAIRIAHALYRPHHVLLAGGIGIRLAEMAGEIYRATCDQLTSIARPGWKLHTADSDLHAAIGAARLAMV